MAIDQTRTFLGPTQQEEDPPYPSFRPLWTGKIALSAGGWVGGKLTSCFCSHARVVLLLGRQANMWEYPSERSVIHTRLLELVTCSVSPIRFIISIIFELDENSCGCYLHRGVSNQMIIFTEFVQKESFLLFSETLRAMLRTCSLPLPLVHRNQLGL
jgi:hypothetical protein